jgi:hypothetical protein
MVEDGIPVGKVDLRVLGQWGSQPSELRKRRSRSRAPLMRCRLLRPRRRLTSAAPHADTARVYALVASTGCLTIRHAATLHVTRGCAYGRTRKRAIIPASR